MVVFTCNNCGESLKKASVEKHYYTRCRNVPKNVSCMDCLKDFHGEEYVAHIRCITEAEKYAGKNYVVKEKKGQKKQDTWIEIVRSILVSKEYQLSAKTRDIFKRLQDMDNVPRKKAKFQNFVANCLKIKVKEAQPVWDVLEKELEKMKAAKQQEIAATKTAVEEDEKAKELEINQKNGIKRKQEQTIDNQEEEKTPKKKKKVDAALTSTEANGTTAPMEESVIFPWSAIIGKVVGKHPEGLTIERLKNKLLKKYKKKFNLEELNKKKQKKFEKKFSQKLKECAVVKVEADLVKPC